MLDDPYTVVAARHQSSQVDSAHFKILGDRNRLLHDRCIEDSRNNHLLPGLQKRPLKTAVGFANGLCSLGRSQVRGLGHEVTRHGNQTIPALSHI